jgi:predicted phosphodiesterase
MRQLLGVLGDVHGNARALRAALAHVRRRPIDGLVFLGDLLSYGPDVDEVLDRVGEEVSRGARVVLGNHDLLYRNLLSGESAYRDRLPPWLKETVTHTFDQLAAGDADRLLAIPFERTIRIGPLLIAHANPFGDDPDGTPDWRYINHPEDYGLAADALVAGGAWAGMFGHTHRPRIVQWPSGRGLGDDVCPALVGFRPAAPGDALILNAGSVGQPRNLAARSTVCFVAVGEVDEPMDVEIETLEYDVAGHLAAIESTDMSRAVRDRLAGFFRAAIPG